MITNSITLQSSPSASLGLETQPFTPSINTLPPCKHFINSSVSTNFLTNGALLPQQSSVRPSNPSQCAFQMPSISTARSFAQIARSAQVPAGQVSGLHGVALNSAPVIPIIASKIMPNPTLCHVILPRQLHLRRPMGTASHSQWYRSLQ